MTDDRPPLAELVAKAGDSDFLRSVAEAVLQTLMEADVEGRRAIVGLHIGPSEAETFYLGVNAVRSPSRPW